MPASSSCSRPGGSTSRPRESAIPLTNYSDSMDAAGVPYEHLDAAEIRRRWPQFTVDRRHPRSVPARERHRDGGARQRGARAHGARARCHPARSARRSSGIRSVDGEIEVTAGGTAYRCRRLVIAAGAWSNGALTHFGVHLPLRVTKEQVTYFATAAPGRLPAGPVSDLDLDGRPLLLRLPHLRRSRARRRGRTRAARGHGRDRGPSSPTRPRSSGTVDFLGQYIPKALGPIIYTKTCLYTLTPDRDFVIDAVPGHPDASVGDRRRPRLQVRVARRADPDRARDRRADRARPRAVPDRPTDPAARESAGELHGVRWLGCVEARRPPLRPGTALPPVGPDHLGASVVGGDRSA